MIGIATAILITAAAAAAAQEVEYAEALRQAQANREEEALSTLLSILRRTPSFDRAYRTMAALATRSGRGEALRQQFAEQARIHPDQPYAHTAMAELYLAERRPPEAEDAARRGTAARPLFVPAYEVWLRALQQQGRLAQAEAPLAAQAEREPSPVPRHALGMCLLVQGKARQAIPHFERALTADPALFAALYGLHHARYEVQDFAGTLSVLDRMEALVKPGDRDRRSYIAGRRGVVLKELGRHSEAVSLLESAAAAAIELGDQRRQLHFQGNLATVYGYFGDYEKASATSREMLQLARRLGDRLSEGRIHGQLARFHSAVAGYSAAIHSYQAAIDIAREVKDAGSEADQLKGLAEILAASGKADAALEYIDTAIAMVRKRKNPWLEARHLVTRAIIQRERMRVPAALAAARESRRMSQQLGDRFSEAHAALLSGELQATGGRGDLLQALALAREGQSRALEARSLIALGRLSDSLREQTRAAAHYRDALAIGKQILAPEVLWAAHAGLAAIHHKQARRHDARLHYIGAIEALEKIRAGLGRPEDRASFFSGRLDTYRGAVSLLVDLHRKEPGHGYDAEAFHYGERGRARSYLELIADSRNGRPETGADLAGPERAARARLGAVQARLLQAYAAGRGAREIEAIQRELARADEAYESLLWKAQGGASAAQDLQPLRLAEAQRELGRGRVLLEYLLGPRESFLFAVTAERLRIYRLPAAAALERDVAVLRAAVARGPSRAALSNFVVAARKLYLSLVQPAAALLASGREIIVAPDGILHYLPFEVLLSKPPAAGELDVSRLPYLVRARALSYAPSMSVLATLERDGRRTPPRTAALLAYGDVAESPRLPYSRLEVDRVAKLFPAATVRTGASATETRLKLDLAQSNHTVLHFAVHGVPHKSRPRLSGLVLRRPAAGEEEDGLLQAYEIVGLRVNARLVVLSACDTGLGKEVPGEGLAGLGQAFFHAGASAVAVSLWKVEDASTADLMVKFYQRLRAPAGLAEALRQAKLEQLGEGRHAHPYFWAGFTLVGRSRRMM
jgi:CHAT domain-containing protein/tetratricopeptide (TPR) repeat protein